MRVAPLFILVCIAGCLPGGAPDRDPAAVGPTPGPGIVVNGERGSSSYSRFATIQGSCAPWDGAAIELLLSPSRPAETGPTPPWIVVSVWKSRDEVSGGTFRFPDGSGRVGAVTHCRSEDNCEPVESGVVRFDRFVPGKPATGTFDLILKGGRRERGGFSAEWRELSVPCG